MMDLLKYANIEDEVRVVEWSGVQTNRLINNLLLVRVDQHYDALQ
jgi:hypothetical protein